MGVGLKRHTADLGRSAPKLPQLVTLACPDALDVCRLQEASAVGLPSHAVLYCPVPRPPLLYIARSANSCSCRLHALKSEWRISVELMHYAAVVCGVVRCVPCCWFLKHRPNRALRMHSLIDWQVPDTFLTDGRRASTYVTSGRYKKLKL